MRLSPRKLHRSKPTGGTRINVARTADPQRREQFVASLVQSLQDLPDQDATARWNTLSNTIYNAAITAFGKRERPNQDWYNANLHVMVPIIETKREALLAHKHNPCEKTLSALRSARSIAQRTARRCVNDYWLKIEREYPKLSRLRKRTRHVRWHQSSRWPHCKEDGSTEIHIRKDAHRPG